MAASFSFQEASTSGSTKENNDEKIKMLMRILLVFHEFRLAELLKSLHEIPKVIVTSDVETTEINNIQDQVITNGSIDPESLESLMTAYQNAQIQVAKEEKAIRKSLEIIYKIRNLRLQKIKSLQQSQRSSTLLKLLQVTAMRMPVWFPTDDEQPPPLCGAIEPPSSYVAKIGDLVAALVKQEGEDRWIVAKAVAYNNGKYEVEDIDVTETHRDFTLDKKLVKPLPLMRADPVLCPEAFFSCNQYVLAMYPQTTCFFKAVVIAIPKTSIDGYEVLFEDDYYNHTVKMIVPQRFILSYPS